MFERSTASTRLSQMVILQSKISALWSRTSQRSRPRVPGITPRMLVTYRNLTWPIRRIWTLKWDSRRRQKTRCFCQRFRISIRTKIYLTATAIWIPVQAQFRASWIASRLPQNQAICRSEQLGIRAGREMYLAPTRRRCTSLTCLTCSVAPAKSCHQNSQWPQTLAWALTKANKRP